MTGPLKERWPLRAAIGDNFQDFDQLECGNSNPPQGPTQQVTCRTCRTPFVPLEMSHKRCIPCHRAWQLEREALSRKRNNDGVRAFQLRSYLHTLRSDDAEASQWLAELLREVKP